MTGGFFFPLVFGTFVSEDLACITAALLIQRGEISATAGIAACTAGIVSGDLGLWAIGRLCGRAVLGWPWLGRQLPESRMEELRLWLESRAAGAMIGSRFLPGTRLPIYVLAGILRLPVGVFAFWSFLAALLWTPTLVLLAAGLDDAGRSVVGPIFGSGAWLSGLLVAVASLVLVRTGRAVGTRSGRTRIAARLSRYARWEFWPMWLFYSPVAVWVAILAVRHGGLSTITAANPGMTDGGTVGESKAEILARLPADCTIPFVLIPRGSAASRTRRAIEAIAPMGWEFPLIMKPDVGQRGLGVKLARSVKDIAAYLSWTAAPVLIQPYHEGPFEAGVFYYRLPGWTHGRIFSITDKQFPFVVGDGASTLEQLIWSHPRYRMQAWTFRRRHRDVLQRVLESGERFQLAIAGNHAQGTLFRNGWHLWTPAIERRVDEISRAYGGFFVGRFDIRYRDVEAFKAGRDLAIVELNGATAESTSIYDPDASLFAAYRELFRQWSIVFAIGAANIARGASASSHRRLFELLRAHAMAKSPFPGLGSTSVCVLQRPQLSHSVVGETR